MEIKITITAPLVIKKDTTVGSLKQFLSEKLGLQTRSIIADVNAIYNVDDSTIIDECDHVEFRLQKTNSIQKN